MAKSKRLVRGVDWHAWCWKCGDSGLIWAAGQKYDSRKPNVFLQEVPDSEANLKTAEHVKCHCPGGKWVRVRFVEVKPKKGREK